MHKKRQCVICFVFKTGGSSTKTVFALGCGDKKRVIRCGGGGETEAEEKKEERMKRKEEKKKDAQPKREREKRRINWMKSVCTGCTYMQVCAWVL